MKQPLLFKNEDGNTTPIYSKFIFECDGALVLRDANMEIMQDDFCLELGEVNHAYTQGMIDDHGFSWASKDGKEWWIAIGYLINDAVVNPLRIIAGIPEVDG